MENFNKEIKNCLEGLFQEPYTSTMLSFMALVLAADIARRIKKGVFCK